MPKEKCIIGEASFVEVGISHCVILLQNGNVITFGGNLKSCLGKKEVEESSYKTTEQSTKKLLSNIYMISAGDYNGAAFTNDGKLYIWGEFSKNDIFTEPIKIEVPSKHLKPKQMCCSKMLFLLFGLILFIIFFFCLFFYLIFFFLYFY